MTGPELKERCQRLLTELGLVGAADPIAVAPLTGGVSSDVLRVEAGGAVYCVKFALQSLRVAARWDAPVHRNRTEYAWLEFASTVAAGSVPRLYGHSARENGFAMEMIVGDVRNWKEDLLAGNVDRAAAEAVGDLLGRLHAASADGVPGADFDNADDFYALRLEPYFVHLVPQYPRLADRIDALVKHYRDCRIALIHGDVSPKNILLRDGHPILLDAECATMGDPAFDPGFCLNHLFLKAIHLPAHAAALLDAARGLWSTYCARVDWEPVATLEARVAGLAPLFLLARVDGKSPAEYLDPAERETVRAAAIRLLDNPPTTIEQIITRLEGVVA